MALTVKGIDALASVMSHLRLPALLLATPGAQAHALRAGVPGHGLVALSAALMGREPAAVGTDYGLREGGLVNNTKAMFAVVEGDWDEVMAVVKSAVDAVAARAPRVSLVLKADIRPGVTDGLTSKVETIERHLAE